MGGDPAHPMDLVRGERDSEAGAADQQRSIGESVSDHLGGSDGDCRVGSSAGRVDSDIDDGLDEFACFEIGLDAFLVLEPGVVGADDEAKFLHYVLPKSEIMLPSL